MSREVKFRGRCRKTGEWIYGDLMHKAMTAESKIALVGIAPHGCYPVDVDVKTLGQFTGMHDRYHKEVFEGDIVSSDFYLPEIMCLSAISYCNDSMRFIFDSGEQDAFEYGKIKVIGNVHDNPELLNE